MRAQPQRLDEGHADIIPQNAHNSQNHAKMLPMLVRHLICSATRIAQNAAYGPDRGAH